MEPEALAFGTINAGHRLVQAYVSKEDHDALAVKAKAAGMTLSKYAAKILTGHATAK